MNDFIFSKSVVGLAGALVLGLSLSGCGPSGIGLSNNLGGQDVTTSETTSEAEPLSPFDEFRGILWGMGMDDDSRRRQFEADRVVEENLIAQCMHELGFDYIPNLDSVQLVFRENENWRPHDPDWIAQYGYGWVVTPAGGRPAPGGIISLDISALGPNSAIVAELSETEAQAWNNALWNQGAGFRREVPGYGVQMDCFNWARMTVSSQNLAHRNDEEFAPLMEAIGRMQDGLRNDISDADRAWSNCMADAGFPGIDLQWQAEDIILRELNDTSSAVRADPEWREANQVGNPSPENSQVMAELQQREVAMATADHNCQVSTDFTARREAHIFEVENQFITDHRAALEALRNAAEQAE